MVSARERESRRPVATIQKASLQASRDSCAAGSTWRRAGAAAGTHWNHRAVTPNPGSALALGAGQWRNLEAGRRLDTARWARFRRPSPGVRAGCTRLGDEAYDAHVARGAAMSYDELVAHPLDELD